ncbi:hypothetical protein GIB67_035739, partial [Kingdonia uniflora]
LHGRILKSGCDGESLLCDQLIDVYIGFGGFSVGLECLKICLKKRVSSWNCIIHGLTRGRLGDRRVLHLFLRVIRESCFNQRGNINAAVKKFSEDFAILLFHYDGWTTEWDQFEWSKRAIHIIIMKQTKWWYAKRFLHPDVVAAYEYIFISDKDLGVEHFNADK